jgi:hypothetical protein
MWKRGISKYEVHKNERYRHLFLDTAYHDILFIGTSKIHTGVNPRVIDSICKADSYNAGVEGGSLYEMSRTLFGYLENHRPPEYLFLTLDLFSFHTSTKLFNYTTYIPYRRNKVIRSMLRETGDYTVLHQTMPFLVLSDLDDYTKMNAVKGFAGKTEISEGEFHYKGFLSNSEETMDFDTTSSIKPLSDLIIDLLGVKILHEIIEICNKKNIRLVFTYAPEYKQGIQKAQRNVNQFFQLVEDIAKKNNIPYLRHDSLAICTDPALFANIGHLNKPGAEVYSAILGYEILKLRRNL